MEILLVSGKIDGVSFGALRLISKQRTSGELGMPVSAIKDMASKAAGRSNNGDVIGDRTSPVLLELMAVSYHYNTLDFELGAQH